MTERLDSLCRSASSCISAADCLFHSTYPRCSDSSCITSATQCRLIGLVLRSTFPRCSAIVFLHQIRSTSLLTFTSSFPLLATSPAGGASVACVFVNWWCFALCTLHLSSTQTTATATLKSGGGKTSSTTPNRD